MKLYSSFMRKLYNTFEFITRPPIQVRWVQYYINTCFVKLCLQCCHVFWWSFSIESCGHDLLDDPFVIQLNHTHFWHEWLVLSQLCYELYCSYPIVLVLHQSFNMSVISKGQATDPQFSFLNAWFSCFIQVLHKSMMCGCVSCLGSWDTAWIITC